MHDPFRRSLLAGSAALAAQIALGLSARSAEGEGLHARARRKGLYFGAAVTTRHLAEPDLRAAILAECGLIAGENEQQWRRMEAEPGKGTAESADALAAFARQNDIMIRGHSLLWHQAVPQWAASLDPPAFRAACERRIRSAAARFSGRMVSWDVVNEAIRIEDGRSDGMRQSRLLADLGPDFVGWTFDLAREADPHALLIYNDFGVEHARNGDRRKRAAILKLLEGMKRAGKPVNAFGVQAHLKAGAPFEAAEWRGFLKEVAGLGLTIAVTELDVEDRDLPADVAIRDAATAELAGRFLDATLDERAVQGVTAWGLSDRTTWLNHSYPTYDPRRPDGLPQRSLPLDRDLGRKPMWSAIARALDAAPART